MIPRRHDQTIRYSNIPKMVCPNPFTAIEASQPPFDATWDFHCNWATYLHSDAASIQGRSYCQENCRVQQVNQTVFRCPLLDEYCNSAELTFASAPLLATCAVYSNLTLETARNSSSTTIQTVHHDGQIIIPEDSFNISSAISTGLTSYCALVPGCSQSKVCSTASFFSTNVHLSREGIAVCWEDLCSFYHATINPDFGGFGARLQGPDHVFSANHTLDDTFILAAAFDCPALPCNSCGISSCQDLRRSQAAAKIYS